jgi:hypothetical protein
MAIVRWADWSRFWSLQGTSLVDFSCFARAAITDTLHGDTGNSLAPSSEWGER